MSPQELNKAIDRGRIGNGELDLGNPLRCRTTSLKGLFQQWKICTAVNALTGQHSFLQVSYALL
jgi:hypothetical protein